MDADGYGQRVLLCGFLQAEDEFRVLDWLAEFEAPGRGQVVCCLGRGKGLLWDSAVMEVVAWDVLREGRGRLRLLRGLCGKVVGLA